MQNRITSVRTGAATALIAGACLASSALAQDHQRLIGDFTEESPRSQGLADSENALITSGILRRVGLAGGAAQDMYISKIRTQTGLEEWTTQIGGPADDSGLCAEQLRSREHILLGHSLSTPPNFQLVLSKLDPLGNVLWSRIYLGDPTIYSGAPKGGTVREVRPPAAVPANNPGDLVVATGNTLFGPNVRAHLLRTDPNGTPIFGNIYTDLRYADGGEHAFADFRELPDRSIICVGTITDRDQGVPGGPPVTTQKILLVRVNAAGAVLWARTYSYPAAAVQTIRLQQGRGVDLANNDSHIIVSASLQVLDSAGLATDFVQYLRTDLAGNPLAYRVYKNLHVSPPSLRSIHESTNGEALIHANMSRNVLPAVAPPIPAPVVAPISPTGPAGLMLIDGPGNPLWAYSYSPLTLTTDDQAAVGSNPLVRGPVTQFTMLAKKTLTHGYDVAPNQGDMLFVLTRPDGKTTCMAEPMPISVDAPQPLLGEVPMQWINEPAGTFWQFASSHPNFTDTRYTCPGDYNADCRVDFADMNEVLSFFGVRYNFSDLNLVLGNFGGGC